MIDTLVSFNGEKLRIMPPNIGKIETIMVKDN